MDRAQKYNEFWNSFGIPAYDESTVPLGSQMPYITYEYADSSFNSEVSLSCSIWYRSDSWSDITMKSEEIRRAISSGKTLVHDDGLIWIKPGNPFIRRMSDSDDSIRRIIVNITMEGVNK